MSHYSLRDAARILRVSPVRLRNWERTNLVQAKNRGEDRVDFDFNDLVSVRVLLALLDKGVSLRRIRQHVDSLRERIPEIEDPVRSLRVWMDGSERMVVCHDGALLEPDGQAVLDFEESESVQGAVTPLLGPPKDESSLREEAEECFARGCEFDTDPATFGEAVECYLQGIELEPEFADCHCNLGAVYYNRGERTTARRCFERCLELDENHLEANFNLGNLLEEVGEDERALHHYRRALAADPLYSDLHVNLALLYEKLGSPAQARKHWRRYLQIDGSGPWSEMARKRVTLPGGGQKQG